jgi:hypothetical protein
MFPSSACRKFLPEAAHSPESELRSTDKRMCARDCAFKKKQTILPLHERISFRAACPFSGHRLAD